MSKPSLLQRYGHALRNLAWLSGASLAVKPLWFAFVTVLCARVLGAEGYGAFSTALSLSTLVFAGTSFGINQYTVREVAADRSLASLHLTNFTTLRLVAYAIATLVALLTAWALDYERGLMVAVGVACIYQAAVNLREYGYSFFQAFERLQPQAVSVVLDKVLVIAFGTALLFATRSPSGTLFGMMLGMVLTAGGTLWWISRYLAPLRRSELNPTFLARSLRPLVPFGLVSLFGMVFFRVDTVMVEALLGLTPAGQYGLAFRLVDALHMLPILVAQAVAYPRMARLASEGDYRELNTVTWMGAGLLVITSTPLALGITLAAAPLVNLLTPDPNLAPASEVLGILVWSLPLTSLRTVFFFVLLAIGDQRFIAWALGLGVVFNVTLNSFMIPAFGTQGAAVATIVSEITLLLPFLLRYVKRQRDLRAHPSL